MFQSFTSNYLYRGWQGYALAEPLWPLVPTFSSQGTRKSQFFHTNHMSVPQIVQIQKLGWVRNESFSEPLNQRMVKLQTGTKELEKIGKLFVSILTKINPNGAVFFFKDISILSREETCKKKKQNNLAHSQKWEFLYRFVSCNIKHVSSNKML